MARRGKAEESEALQPWRNRIVGYGEVPTESILGNEANWRIHPKTQTDALNGVLKEIGVVQNILINQRTSEQWPSGDRHVSTMIDGHARTLLALREGQETLPATYVDLTPAEEAEIMAVLDPIAALAGADREKLASLLADVHSGEAAVMAMLEGLAIEHKLIPGGMGRNGNDDEVDTTPVPAPESNVRMVQIFLTEETFSAFQSQFQALGAFYGITILTDIVVEAITRAATALDDE